MSLLRPTLIPAQHFTVMTMGTTSHDGNIISTSSIPISDGGRLCRTFEAIPENMIIPGETEFDDNYAC